MTDEQLNEELRKGKLHKAAGTALVLLGVAIALAGAIKGFSMPLIIAGVIIFSLGKAVQSKSKDSASRQAFDTIVPELVKAAFEGVDFAPSVHLVDAKASNILLPSHAYLSGSGYMKGTYRGLPTELCNITLTDVDEFQREETGMWEKNERVVYTGQWMACETGQTLTAGLTIWPRDKLDKIFNSRAIKTDNEVFNKRFNLSCNDEQAVLRFLTQSRIERFLALADGVFTKFAVSLHEDGKLYIAAHSGRGFFDIGKGKESSSALRQRFSSELKWFTDMIDIFRPL